MPGLKMLPGNTLDLGHKIPTAKRDRIVDSSILVENQAKWKQTAGKYSTSSLDVLPLKLFDLKFVWKCQTQKRCSTSNIMSTEESWRLWFGLSRTYLVRQVTYGSTFELCHGYNPNGKSKLWKGLTNNFSWISLKKQSKQRWTTWVFEDLTASS